MRSVHRSILFLASAVSLSLAACGGGDDGGDETGGDDTVEGDHYQYVMNKMVLPVGSSAGLKLDIDGDGDTENRLGSILATLQSQSNGELDLQASIDRGVNKGDITLLGDIQTKSLTTATNAGFRVFLGTIVSPAACTNPEDEATCGQHLTGTGSFTAEASDALVAGSLVNGRFTGSGGTLKLKLALEGTLIDLTLSGRAPTSRSRPTASPRAPSAAPSRRPSSTTTSSRRSAPRSRTSSRTTAPAPRTRAAPTPVAARRAPARPSWVSSTPTTAAT
jgi:hypothetical protein